MKHGGQEFIPFVLNMPNLFELFIAKWLSTNLTEHLSLKVQHHAQILSSAVLEIRVDMVLHDNRSCRDVAVLDTKYKGVEEPAIGDIQQAAFYANELGVRQAFLIYPSRQTKAFWARNGDVRVEALSFDLALPVHEAGREFLQTLYEKLLG